MTEHVSAFDEILNALPVTPRRVNLLDNPDDQTEEPTMPRGVYDRKPREVKADAPKKRGRKPKGEAPPVAKKPRGEYSGVLAELRAKREQIDAAILAIEALG